MTVSQPRKPAGVPVGGQFATKTRPAPGYSLDSEDAHQLAAWVNDVAASGATDGLGAGPDTRGPAEKGGWRVDDPEAGTLTPETVADRLGFDRMPPGQRRHAPSGRPFSITAETRRGVKGFRVYDMRSSASIRVGSKRNATKIAKLIEADQRRPDPSPNPARDEAVTAATDTLSELAGPEAAADFARREAERCPQCEGYGLVKDPDSLKQHPGSPSLADDITCPTCNGRGRVTEG